MEGSSPAGSMSSGSDASVLMAQHLESFPEPPQAEEQRKEDSSDPLHSAHTLHPRDEEHYQTRKDGATVSAAPEAETSSNANFLNEVRQKRLSSAPLSILGLDAELDALATAPSQSNQENQDEHASPSAVEGDTTVTSDTSFAYGRTSSNPAQVFTPLEARSLSRSNSGQLSISSSNSGRSSTLENVQGSRGSSISSGSAKAISPDSKVKRRTSLLGALGLVKSGSKKEKSRSSLTNMTSISENDSASETSSKTASTSSQNSYRHHSLRRGGNASSDLLNRSTASLTSSDSHPLPIKPSQPMPMSVPIASSLKSLPLFPASQETLQPFKQRAEFLMKFSAFGWRSLTKHGAWRPRFILLSAVPAFKPAPDVPLGGHHILLSCFKTNDVREPEVERLRLTKDSVVCVTDEVGEGKLYVLKVANGLSSNGSSDAWYFSLNDDSDRKFFFPYKDETSMVLIPYCTVTVWLRMLKSLVLQLRGVKATDKDPAAQKGISDAAPRNNFTDLALELDAKEQGRYSLDPVGTIDHPFAAYGHQSETAGYHASAAYQRRRNLSQDSHVGSRSWAASQADLLPPSVVTNSEVHAMPRPSDGPEGHQFNYAAETTAAKSNVSLPPEASQGSGVSAGLAKKGSLRTHAPDVPLPPLPPIARQNNQRHSVYSQSSDDTSFSFAGSSSLSSSCGHRISASSGGSLLTSPESSVASRSASGHAKGSEATPSIPVRSPLRKSPQTLSKASTGHSRPQTAPSSSSSSPSFASPSGDAFDSSVKGVSKSQEHGRPGASTLSLLDEVRTQEFEEEGQLKAFSLSRPIPENFEDERRPRIRFEGV